MPRLRKMGRKGNRPISIKQAAKRHRERKEEEESVTKKIKEPTERIKIVLHNARGLDEITEQDAVNLITNQQPEVFGILETHLREENGTRKLIFLLDIPWLRYY